MRIPFRPQDEPRPKLLEQVRRACGARQFSPGTIEAYCSWVRRYVRFHALQHPAHLGAEHVAAFLSSLANDGKVSASTQNQAASALLFLYRDVLQIEIDPPPGVVRPARPRHLPVVLTRDEVAKVLAQLQGTHKLIAKLLYGSGLRLLEALQLRVKDITLGRNEIIVRSGKGGQDRVTMLPESVKPELQTRLLAVEQQYTRDLARGALDNSRASHQGA